MVLFSFIVLITAFFLGYTQPKRTGWLLILILPLLYPSLFIFVPSTLVPVTSNRFGFAALLGIISSNYQDIQLKRIFKIKFVKIYLIFSILLILSSLRDSPKFVLATYLLDGWYGIGLGFVMIKSQKDLDRLFRIMVWQSAIIGLLIIIEYFTSFNYVLFLRNAAHQMDVSKINTSYMRSGVYRPMGIDGNSVQTAYRLAFLFPLTIWYSLKGRFVNFIPLFLVIIGLVFLQTRAAFIAIALSMVFLFYLLQFRNKNKRINKSLYKKLFWGIILGTILFFTFHTLNQIGTRFFESFLGSNTKLSVENDTRDRFIFIALNFIKNNLFWGYGSPSYVYYDLMNAMDLPSPVLYFLVGGIFFLMIYLYLLYTLVFSLTKYISIQTSNIKLNTKLIFLSVGLLAGNIVLFFNWQENHNMIMYLTFVATIKVVLFYRN